MANGNWSSDKESFWRLVLEEHAKSGLNAREFCQRESLSEPSFYSWRRKIRNRDKDGELVPVKVVPDDSSVRDQTKKKFPVEIVSGEIVIGVNDTCSVEAICRVLTAVRQVTKEQLPC